MKENLDLLIKKIISKAFPEFSNKVTWTLITVGIGFLALPAPTYLLFINLVLDSYNKKTSSNINLIDINNITPSSGIALSLIVTGLIYHLIIKGIQLYPEVIQENHNKEINDRKRISDIALYEKFTELLPPTSLSIELFKNQDFGASYHENSIKDFDKLRYGWGYADQHFHDHELESKVTNLHSEIMRFDNFLAQNSHYIMKGPTLSMLTDRDREMDFEWTPETEEKVKKANEWGTKIYELYNDFIIACKNNLAV